jgi:NADPH-dependent F420 reductase
MKVNSDRTTIAIIGGTGKEGKGLALRWARKGYRILIGSRSIQRAKASALEILDSLHGKAIIDGAFNFDACRLADIIVLTVPYEAHRNILENIKEALSGKILVDVTVPLRPSEVTKVHLPPLGSAAMEARSILDNNVQITSAFQNIAVQHLLKKKTIGCEVFVTGTSKEARIKTLELVSAAGMTGWDAGPLENSVVAEGLTSVLIYINKKYGSTTAGIKIIDVKRR